MISAVKYLLWNVKRKYITRSFKQISIEDLKRYYWLSFNDPQNGSTEVFQRFRSGKLIIKWINKVLTGPLEEH